MMQKFQVFYQLFTLFSIYSQPNIGIPGTECLFGGICSGGSVCIDVLCLCVGGQREMDGKCVDETVYDTFIRESEETAEKADRPRTIGLAGHPCGDGGVCRPSTKCIDGTCKCSQGYNPSFGECVRDLTVPRHVPKQFVPNNKSVLRFPSRF